MAVQVQQPCRGKIGPCQTQEFNFIFYYSPFSPESSIIAHEDFIPIFLLKFVGKKSIFHRPTCSTNSLNIHLLYSSQVPATVLDAEDSAENRTLYILLEMGVGEGRQ